jgi:hypothetical protein
VYKKPQLTALQKDVTIHTYTKKELKMFNTLAKAKLVYNKQKELYKLVVAFNVHTKQKENGDIVHLFPTQAKCAYVSGDIQYKELHKELIRLTEAAKKQLRTDNIEFV